MDLVTQMRVFVRVAEAQGFTAAARQLGVSKSVVSKYVGELEDRLGVRLFHRTTRHLSLSEAGAGYYERCTHILAEIEEAEAAIGAIDDEPRGTVRLVLPARFALAKVMPALPPLLRQWPRLNVDLVLDDRPDAATESMSDIAVRLVEDAGTARVLAPVPMVLVAAPGYMQAASAPAVPQDLAFQNCLTLARPLGETSWRLRAGAGEQAIRVTGTLQANNLTALHEAAVAGLGIALLPLEMAAEDLAAGRLVRVLDEFAPLPWSLAAVKLPGESPSARVRVVLDLLAEAARGTRELTGNRAKSAA